jgi:hypothetical protein
MATGQIPEAWIGEEVALQFWQGDGRSAVKGTLEAVNDRGLGLVVQAEEKEDELRRRFYPWSAVLNIEHGVDEEPPQPPTRNLGAPR